MQSVARAFGATDESRIRFVHLPSATLYAQDSARAAVNGHGFPVLLLPRGIRPELGRDEDGVSGDEARRTLGVRVIRSRTYWEGGNVISDSDTCVVGADTVAENMARLELIEREVITLLAADLGTRIHVIGDVSRAHYDTERDELAPSGQATFHIDLDVALLGAMDGSAGRWRWWVTPATASACSITSSRIARSSRGTSCRRVGSAGCSPKFAASARLRRPLLTQYRETLTTLGYRVVGMLDLRLLGKDGAFGASRFDLSYCNVLPGLRRGRPAVHYLPCGIRALDRAAEARFRMAGVEPVAVSTDPRVADALMQLYAGLRCFCGPLA